MIFLPKIKAADSAHKGILPSVTRPFSVFWHGPGYETTTVLTQVHSISTKSKSLLATPI